MSKDDKKLNTGEQAGPRWVQMTSSSTASSGPSYTTSTLPSGRLRTQPLTSWAVAR